MAIKILAVDDDPSYLDVLQQTLTAEGYEVATASSGMQGLKAARADKPDIVLLDIMMPKMHGFEVCQQLRADDAMAGLKIIIISAKGYKTDFDAAKHAGADHYLVKPFKIEDLFELLQRFSPAPPSAQ